MSRRSAIRLHRGDLHTSPSVGRHRWLTLGASAMIASSVVVGPGLATGLVAAPAVPVVSVQDVALTADSGLGSILDMLGLGDLTVGAALGLVGLDADETVGGAVDSLLGSLGSTSLDSLLSSVVPDISVGTLLGYAGLEGTDSLGSMLGEINGLISWTGLDLGSISLEDLQMWLGFTIPADDLTSLGLTESSTVDDILGSEAVGAALGLDGSLGGTSFDDLLGVTDDTSLADMVLGFIGVNGSQTIGDAVASLMGLDADTTLLTMLGDALGISGLDASTPLVDLLGGLF